MVRQSINKNSIMNRFKKYIRFSLIILLAHLNISVYSQNRPFGTIKVAKDIYIDETEVDVGSWLSYYTWVLIHEGFEPAQEVLPDSNVVEPELWAYIKNNSTDYIGVKGRYSQQPIGYFGKKCKECVKYGRRLSTERKYCAMLDFPITGVTFEQVNSFCKWRTKMQGNNKFTFRLPTPEEWKNFALKNLSETEKNNGFQDSLYKNKCPLYNYKIICNCNNNSTQGNLYGIAIFGQGKNGLFDIFGNVSEMTSIKGIAKGGNFTENANQCHIDSVQHYYKSERWLGFRCIAVQKSLPENVKQTIEKSSLDIKSSNGKYGKYIDPRDGKIYPTVCIGKQTWMSKNLAFKPEIGKCWAYGKKQSNVDKYGYLYNWETAKNVCPAGWHLPSKEEFETLIQNIGGDGSIVYKKLIPSGSSGLVVLSSGLRFGMNFTPIDGGSAFWSFTENGGKRAWGLTVGRLEPKAYVDDGWYKNYGLSVRCVQDH